MAMLDINFKMRGMMDGETVQIRTTRAVEEMLTGRIKKHIKARRYGLKRTIEIHAGEAIRNAVAGNCDNQYISDIIRHLPLKKGVGSGDTGYDASINSTGNIKFILAFSKQGLAKGSWNPYWFIMNTNYGRRRIVAPEGGILPTVVFNEKEASKWRGSAMRWKHGKDEYLSPSGRQAYVRFTKVSSSIKGTHWIERGIRDAKADLVALVNNWSESEAKRKGVRDNEFIKR